MLFHVARLAMIVYIATKSLRTIDYAVIHCLPCIFIWHETSLRHRRSVYMGWGEELTRPKAHPTIVNASNSALRVYQMPL